jgi:hypothetical protein
LSGYKAEGVWAGDATLIGLFPLLRATPLELDLRVGSGARYLRDVGWQGTPHESAVRWSSEVAILAHVRLGERGLFRAGAIIGADLELDPTVQLADQAAMLTVGVGHAITPRVLLYGNVDAGGTYGFDGDNGKTILRGALGLRMTFDADARTAF